MSYKCRTLPVTVNNRVKFTNNYLLKFSRECIILHTEQMFEVLYAESNTSFGYEQFLRKCGMPVQSDAEG